VLLAPNAAFVVTIGSDDDKTIRLWSLDGKQISTVTNRQFAQFGASIDADSSLIAVAGASLTSSRSVGKTRGQVSVYKVAYQGKTPQSLDYVTSVAGHTRGINAVSFAHAVPHLALASADGEWSVWDTRVRYDRGEEPTELARAKGMPFVAVALSPLGKRLVGGTPTELCIFDVRRGQILEQIPTGHYGICAISFSLDGTRLLSGGREDRRLRLWRMEDRSGAI